MYIEFEVRIFNVLELSAFSAKLFWVHMTLTMLLSTNFKASCPSRLTLETCMSNLKLVALNYFGAICI